MLSASTALSAASVHTPFPISPRTASSSSTLSSIITSSPSTSTTTTATTTSTTSSPTGMGTIAPGNAKYSYYGCYNESTAVNGTSGRRALDGGAMEGLDSMTAETCLSFCGVENFVYSGLEYGRECWCANYISVFAAKIDDKECNFDCMGNENEVCGGSLKLTVYERVSVPSAATPRFTKVPTKLFVAGLALMGLVLQMS